MKLLISSIQKPMTLFVISFFLLAFLYSSPGVTETADKKTNALHNDNDSTSAKGQMPLQELQIFVDALHKIRQSYVNEISDTTLLANAIHGMLSELDPHSAYLNEDSFKVFEESTKGEFGGLGIEITQEEGLIKIIAPIDDTPAYKAGIKSGDFIIKLDEKPVRGMSLSDAVGIMRGNPGTQLKLTIMRKGQSLPVELTITRDIIKVKSVKSKILEEGFGYIRIAQFQKKTGNDFQEALKKLQKKSPLKGLIIDLRNNPGGLLDASVAVVDAILDNGLIVYTEGRIPQSQLRFSATPGDITSNIPIIVLINGGSASASEIVAGALQDHNRAIIMGNKSFGKGSVQSVIPLTKNQALKVTTALYYTPKGRSIQAEGITPDIVVNSGTITSYKNKPLVSEAGLLKHLDNGNKDKSNNTTNEKESNSSIKDIQLYEALNLLKGINIVTKGQ